MRPYSSACFLASSVWDQNCIISQTNLKNVQNWAARFVTSNNNFSLSNIAASCKRFTMEITNNIQLGK